MALALQALIGSSRADSHLTVLDDERATAVVKLEFGLRHPSPRDWNVEISAAPGEIGSVWGWHFSRPDRIEDGGRARFRVRDFDPQGAPYRAPFQLPNGRAVLPNGIFVSLDAPAAARVSVRTNHGDFDFDLGSLRQAGRADFLKGDVAAVHTPPVRALTRGEASQHDFPAAAFVDGRLYVAWTTYHNEANALYLAWRAGERWETRRVTPAWGDYYGTAVAGDPEGRIHVLFSEYSGGRWRLKDCLYDPAADRWMPARFVAPEGDRQIFPQATRDAAGRPWVVWQAFDRDNLAIRASHFDGGKWSDPMHVSESAANDWAPSVAAAPDGRVWFAWDSYDRGNYDVMVRAAAAGRLEDAIRVTEAPTRDAFGSVAVDSSNRVWVAWAEAGPRWGKDWGVLGRPGTHLRAGSRIRLARYENGRWSEPGEPLEASVPEWMADRHEYPTVVIGANDLPYVFFRKQFHRKAIPEHGLRLKLGEEERILQPWYDTVRGMSSIHVAAFDGTRWLGARELPLSSGGAFAQIAVAAGERGFAAVWASDGRSYLDPHFRTSQLRWALLDLEARPDADTTMQPFVSEPGDDDGSAAAERKDLARVRAVRWEAEEPLQLFRGDLHRHSDLSADSELDGDILYAYRYALDPGGLDFLAVTDHSGAERLHYYRYQWWRNRQIATMFHRPGRFVTFFGYERTVTYPGGHRNVISTRRELQPVPISDEEFTGAESWAERLYPALLAGGDIAIAHTTAGGGGTDWRDGDARAEPVVEIFQALRGAYDEAGSAVKARGTNREAGFVWRAWEMGRQLGVIVNSDHTSTHQSYACVYAPRLTSEEILAAIKRRRTYGATDNIVLQVEASDGNGDARMMGEEVSTSANPRLRISAQGTDEIARLEIVRSGKVVHAAEPGTAAVNLEYEDTGALAGESYYHVRLAQADGQRAWSSPIWIRRGVD